MKFRAATVLAFVALTGCQTSDAKYAEAERQLNAGYVGYPLYDFLARNNMTPIDAFDMPGSKRIFVFTSPCVSWWHTRRINAERTPASYIVERVEVRGYCNM